MSKIPTRKVGVWGTRSLRGGVTLVGAETFLGRDLSHLRRLQNIGVMRPVLTLRLRSGQAHWANLCRTPGAW
jgi:hypothetical protein